MLDQFLSIGFIRRCESIDAVANVPYAFPLLTTASQARQRSTLPTRPVTAISELALVDGVPRKAGSRARTDDLLITNL